MSQARILRELAKTSETVGAVGCPTCHAKKGRRCVKWLVTGRVCLHKRLVPIMYAHKERVVAAAEARRKEGE